MNTQALWAVVGIMLAAMAGIVAVSASRPNADNAQLYTQIVGFAGTTIAVVLAWAKTAKVAEKTEETNAKLVEVKGEVFAVGARVDGRLTELLESRTTEAHSAGLKQGEQEERNRAADVRGAAQEAKKVIETARVEAKDVLNKEKEHDK